MRKNSSFGVKTFLSSLLVTTALGPAILAEAQTANSEEPEEEAEDDLVQDTIVVRGFLDSLNDSAQVKRNADRVVDSIVAIDIGKLPDSNVGEALQRVTGVQLDRERGEGTRVAIRGLSADLNRAEINGISFAGTSTSRDADFRNIPADFVSRIDVVKSPTASMTDGAVGGWINLVTRRPFDADGWKVAGSVTARIVEAADTDITDEISPEFSVFGSYNYNDKIGAALAFHTFTHESRADIIEDLFWAYYDADGDADNEYVPQLPRYFQSIVSDERMALTGSLQFRPVDNFETILDVTYSERESQVSNLLNNFVNFFGPWTNVVEQDETFTSFTTSPFQFQSLSSEFTEDRETETWSLTSTWEPAENWTVVSTFGSSTGLVDMPLVNIVPTTGQNTGPVNFEQRGPDNVWVSDFDFSQGQDATLFDLWLTIFSQQRVEQEESIAQFDFKYDVDFGIFDSFEFGVQHRETGFDSVGAQLSNNVFFESGLRAQFGNDDAVYNNFIANVMQPIPGSFGELYENNPSGVPSTFYVPDSDLVLDLFYTPEQLADVAAYDPSVQVAGNVWDIEEEITAAYVQANIDTSVFGKPMSGNVGVRFVETDTQTSGFANADFNSPVSFDSSYSDVLPALNLKLDLSEDMVLRFAASEVISRPTITDLVPRLVFNSVTLEASGGNPELDPFRATQADLVFEYYPSNQTSFAAGVFWKDVDSFVETQRIARDLFGDGTIYQFLTPVNGDGATIKGLEVGFNHAFSNLPSPFDGLGVSGNYTYVDSTSLTTNMITGEDLPFPGLSESSYNISLIYEKYGAAARLAYNYRDERLASSTGFGVIGQVTPVFFDEYGSLDASLQYAFNTNVFGFVSGNNLTNDYQGQTGEGGFNRNVSLASWGRSFETGIRVVF